MIDMANYIALGLVFGAPLGWVACLCWHGWRIGKRKAEQDARDRQQDEREVRLNMAEKEVRGAADSLRPYSTPSNR